MNDDELRLLIRAAIARHVSGSAPYAPIEPQLRPEASVGSGQSMSFSQYRIERVDAMCVIEPNAQCDHCGFCKCHGH